MIYLDSSVILARLFLEHRSPPIIFWQQALTSSRLLAYEVWTRINTRKLTHSHEEQARLLLATVDLLDLTPTVLERALEPFPASVRTLDALHLASIDYLRRHGQTIELASYDNRLNAAAQLLGVPLVSL